MTIAVDSSAIVAILRGEDYLDRIVVRMGLAERRLMSAATHLECGIVILSRMGLTGLEKLQILVRSSEIEIVGCEPQDAKLGIEAYRRFGKGSGHPAQLNFGDCFSYALAKSRDVPLLFVGGDFSRTDIVPALASA